MDIKRAKKEIKDSIEAYLAKDEFGDYMIPQIRQRPILLMGPPGIGKTQVMEQVAKMAFVSFAVNPATTMNPLLVEKHFSRKHGPNAYYGQKKKH